MFDGLLHRKFSGKCKQSIKVLNARVCLIRRKKQAMLNFFKKDVADLLESGHEDNAFGRMDGLISEMNQIACYDMIQKLCESILTQLPTLQKQRECPDENKEAVATLIFAAARFSDLPELCDLRHVFFTRFGSPMESHINEEFVYKRTSRSFPKDKKLNLMQEIANEFSVGWDSKSYGQKKPNIPIENQAKKDTPLLNEHMKDILPGGLDDKNTKPTHGLGRKSSNDFSNNMEVKDIHTVSSTIRGIPATHMRVSASTEKSENSDPFGSDAKIPPHTTKSLDVPKMESNIHEEREVIREFTPNKFPPYVKPNRHKNGESKSKPDQELFDDKSSLTKEHKDGSGLVESSDCANSRIIVDPLPPEKDVTQPSASNGNYSINRIPPNVRSNPGKTRDMSPDKERSNIDDKGELVGKSRPKPRSVRKKHHKQQAANELDRPQPSRQSAFEDDYTEDDFIIDKLLVHYSRKGMPDENKTARSRKKAPSADYAEEAQGIIEKPEGSCRNMTELATNIPAKAMSLPTSPAVTPQEFEVPKCRGRVHPRLPDYDELAARFNALKKS